jgi:hypothetical protein
MRNVLISRQLEAPDTFSLGHGARAEEGQAIVEYILLLSMVVGVAIMINSGFRRSTLRLWNTMAKEIAAGCPTGCPPPSSFREIR